ncbi:LOW QUALITY PROTEIN: Serine/threonine protein kinase [Phytophthora megakarya]|uniref:Serine/threonine protein kinase n=1 Tax=Phytophthora megakarya TaxID=4795 RepID=A0A225V1L8_9STRA|nr:LOW QUALITY PROTEIN: Serine/threonine protein kinase [Phytophthora megakarya]
MACTFGDYSTLHIPRTHIQRTHWIGKGAFGSVYYAKWLGTNVVMKQIETNQAEKDNQNQFFQETELWMMLNHKHLVHLYGVDDSEQRPFFICERATCGTLTRFLSKIGYSGLEDHLTDIVFGLGRVIFPGRLESEIGDSRLRECLIDAALGLENLHESGIAHGDLKGDNILVCWDKYTRSTTTKIADFGLSVCLDRHPLRYPSYKLGAIRWKAPEFLECNVPTRESDVFSFGMCIVEAATGRLPWAGICDDNTLCSKQTIASNTSKRDERCFMVFSRADVPF